MRVTMPEAQPYGMSDEEMEAAGISLGDPDRPMTSEAQPGQEQRMVTDTMIEAGYVQACGYPAVALHASHNETRSMVEIVYKAMEAARPTADLGEDGELVERLGDEADLCRNEGASDIASLLDQARDRIKLYREALEKIAADTFADWTIPRDIARAVLSRSGG